jgi:hypothetical protein
MLKKPYKSLTVNRLPRELVDGIKYLAIELDCNIPELVEVLIREGLKQKDTLYADIHRLRQARIREQKEHRQAKKELAALQQKLHGEVIHEPVAD